MVTFRVHFLSTLMRSSSLSFSPNPPPSLDDTAYDMRKALARDVDKRSIIPLREPIYPEDLESP